MSGHRPFDVIAAEMLAAERAKAAALSALRVENTALRARLVRVSNALNDIASLVTTQAKAPALNDAVSVALAIARTEVEG